MIALSRVSPQRDVNIYEAHRREDADHFFRDLFAEDAADRIVEFISQTR